MRANLSFGTVTPTLLLFAAMLLAASAAKADDWLTYQNDRYGTTIDYPDLFKMQPPPDADDGRKFKSADGADFTVSASYFAATTLRLISRSRNTATTSSRISIPAPRSPTRRAARTGSSFQERWATTYFMKSICCRTARR